MRPRSLQGRLLLQQQVLAALVIAVFAVATLALTQSALEGEERRMLERHSRRLADVVDQELAEEPVLQAVADSLVIEEVLPGVRIVVEDSSGRELARSAPDVSEPVAEAMPAGRPATSLWNAPMRARARAACGAWVELTGTDPRRAQALAALARALLIAAVPLWLLAFVISRSVVRRALRPLDRMTWRAAEVSLEPGALTLGTASGIEEIDRLHAAFDRLLGRLGEQLRAERQFAADASHELRTPLTVLSGELEWSLGEDDPSARRRESLRRAAAQVRAMRELVEALLLLRRAGEGGGEARHAFEPVDLSDVVESARRETLSHHPGREADVAVRAALDVVVSGHAVLLTAGVRNLLDNALKFTRPGVPVWVEVDGDADHAWVRVDDGGTGVPDTDRERVFDPFFRGADARAEHAGFGLGLPILRRVARAHGGDVTVGCSDAGGARFVLTLPRWRPAG